MAEINKKSLGEGVITFAHPYTFEGKEYDGVDLSALDNMTTEQLIQCDRIFESSGSVSALKELNVEYACIVAAEATGLPVEFFKGLPHARVRGSRLRSAAIFSARSKAGRQ